MTAGPAVGIWGTSDVENFGDHLFPLIARHELERRRPGVRVRAFAPFGTEHPTHFDGPHRPTPLGEPTPARLDALAAELDLVLVGGGELLHLNDRLLAAVYGASFEEMDRRAPTRFFVEALGPDREERCPVVWHGLGMPWSPDAEGRCRLHHALRHRPYVTVRDERSAGWLRDAGVDATVVPDSAVLLPRLFPKAHRRSTRTQLVVQGNGDLVPFAPQIAGAVRALLDRRPGWTPLVLETGPVRGDGAFADAIVPLLGGHARRLQWDTPLDRLVATLAGSAGFVGSSLHGAITSYAFGRPFVVLDLVPESKLREFARMAGAGDQLAGDVAAIPGAVSAAFDGPGASTAVRDLQARVDEHFDTVAALLDETGRRPTRRLAGIGRRLLQRT